MTNPCLRQASVYDLQFDPQHRWPRTNDGWEFLSVLHALYQAEWRLRGFERSP